MCGLMPRALHENTLDMLDLVSESVVGHVGTYKN